MPAVYPRARVRLSAVAVAFTLSSSVALGLTGTPAQAAASNTPSTSAVPAHSPASVTVPKALIAAATARTFATQHRATKPVQIAGRRLAAEKAAAHTKAVGHKTAVARKKAAAHKKAVARKATARRVAEHKAAVARAQASSRAAFGARVIKAAARYRGTPYRYGAAGPSRFDCSGFTRFIFAKFGISLPHSSSGQYSVVRHVANNDKRVGDLVFFHSSGGHVYHVGIYAGGDEIWAATHTGDFVRLEGMWNASYYVGRIS